MRRDSFIWILHQNPSEEILGLFWYIVDMPMENKGPSVKELYQFINCSFFIRTGSK